MRKSSCSVVLLVKKIKEGGGGKKLQFSDTRLQLFDKGDVGIRNFNSGRDFFPK